MGLLAGVLKAVHSAWLASRGRQVAKDQAGALAFEVVQRLRTWLPGEVAEQDIEGWAIAAANSGILESELQTVRSGLESLRSLAARLGREQAEAIREAEVTYAQAVDALKKGLATPNSNLWERVEWLESAGRELGQVRDGLFRRIVDRRRKAIAEKVAEARQNNSWEGVVKGWLREREEQTHLLDRLKRKLGLRRPLAEPKTPNQVGNGREGP